MKTKVYLLVILLSFCVVSFPQVNGFPDSTTNANVTNDVIMFQVCYNGKPSFCAPRMINVFTPPLIDTYHPPVVSTFAKRIFQNHTLEFTRRDFTSSFAASGNEVLISIRIESLPFHGKIKLAGIDVVKGQEIPAADLRTLEFIPDRDYLGVVSFRWVASDGTDYSVSPASVSIAITPQTIFVPEGFSPNGDGINDFFVITGAEKYTISLRIFNRWGSKVFESSHYNNNWDGTYNVDSLNSSPLPEGTYFFVISFNNGEMDQIGYLTLIR